MTGLTDQQLLRDYSERQTDAAFAELVRRHVNLVYSATLRMVCDAHLAQDVTQAVFIALAQNALSLTDRPVLSGWLHRTAQNLAAKTVRTNVRRRAREQEAATMKELLAAESDTPWEHIAPHLDAALGELSEPDRDAVLLRYFENKSLHEVGQALGTSDDTAQKRVSRAVERLREFFAKRGVTVGASGLVVVISANAVQAAPVGMAVTISTAAAAAGTTIAATTATATKAIAMTTLQKAIIGTTLAVAVGTGVYQARQASTLRSQVQTLQQQQAPLTGQIQQLTREKEEMSRRLVLSPTNGANAKRKLPLAEIEAKIRELDRVDFTGDVLLRRWDDWQKFAASIDPADFLATAELLDRAVSLPVRQLWQDWLTKWAKADPSAAMAYAKTVTSDPWRRVAIERVLQGWAEKDSAAALAWAQQLPAGGELRLAALRTAIVALASKDPQAAFDLMKSTGLNVQWRFGGMQDLFGAWAEKDPAAAIKAADSLSGLQRSRALQGIRQSSWVAEDPHAAIAWMNSLPEGNDKLYAINSIAQQWAYRDMNSAAAWVQQLPEGRAKQLALQNFPADQWAKTDPDAAMTFAQSLKGDAQNNFLQSLGNTLGNTDPTKAMEWANRLPEGQGRDSFIAAMAGGMAQNSPQDAANFVSKLPAGEMQNRAAVTVASSLAKSDPQAAAAWVSAFPAGKTRERAIQGVIDNWSRNDPMAAGQWLATLPADQSQTAIQGYVSAVGDDYPELAVPWVEKIINLKQRNSTIEGIARQWLKTDPTAAQAWLAKTSLPDDRKQLLLKN